MGLLEYQAMPSLPDVAHDGWLCTFTMSQQLEIPSARNWAAPVRAAVTVRKKAGGTARPSRTKSHLPDHFYSSQPGGPPCWVQPLVFGLIGCRYGGRRDAAVSWRCSLCHVIRAHVLSPPFYDGVRFFHPLHFFLSVSRPYCWFLHVLLFFHLYSHLFVLLSSILLPGLFSCLPLDRHSSVLFYFFNFFSRGFSYMFYLCHIVQYVQINLKDAFPCLF
jgi:hypothetical protein